MSWTERHNAFAEFPLGTLIRKRVRTGTMQTNIPLRFNMKPENQPLENKILLDTIICKYHVKFQCNIWSFVFVFDNGVPILKCKRSHISAIHYGGCMGSFVDPEMSFPGIPHDSHGL